MFLKNNSTKIIGIGEVSILPDETKECPRDYEQNPIILKYIANGTFTKTEGADVKGIKARSEVKEPEEMTEDELIRYASDRGIDLGKATTKEGILKKIQEAEIV